MDIQTGDTLEAVAVSHDGKWLAFGGQAGVVTILELASRKSHVFQAEASDTTKKIQAYSLAFSPYDNCLAMGFNSSVVLLWDVEREQPIDNLTTKGGAIRTLAFSDDGHRLAAGTLEGTLETWTDRDPASHRSLKLTQNNIRDVTFSHDGTTIMTLGGSYYESVGEFHRVDFNSLEVLTRKVPFEYGRTSIHIDAFDQGIYFAKRQTFQVALLDGKSLTVEREFDYPSRSLVIVTAISPDRRSLIAGGSNGELVCWDLSSGDVLESYPGHTGPIMDVAYFPGGKQFVSASQDGWVRIWNSEPRGFGMPFAVGDVYVTDLVFAPDSGDLITVCRNGSLEGRDLATRKELWKATANEYTYRAAITPDGDTLVTCHAGGRLRWWNARTGECLKTAGKSQDGRGAFCLAVSADGGWLAVGEGLAAAAPPFSGQLNSEILIWDVARQEVVQRWFAHDRRVMSLAFGSRDHELLSYGMDKIAHRWDWSTKELLQEYRLGPSVASDILLLDHGHTLLAGDAEGTLWRWSVADGNRLPSMAYRDGVMRHLAISPDGSTLALTFGSSDARDAEQPGMIQLIDTRTWDEKTTLITDFGQPNMVAFSPDGQYLAAGSYQGQVLLWEAPAIRPWSSCRSTALAPCSL